MDLGLCSGEWGIVGGSVVFVVGSGVDLIVGGDTAGHCWKLWCLVDSKLSRRCVMLDREKEGNRSASALLGEVKR